MTDLEQELADIESDDSVRKGLLLWGALGIVGIVGVVAVISLVI